MTDELYSTWLGDFLEKLFMQASESHNTIGSDYKTEESSSDACSDVVSTINALNFKLAFVTTSSEFFKCIYRIGHPTPVQANHVLLRCVNPSPPPCHGVYHCYWFAFPKRLACRVDKTWPIIIMSRSSLKDTYEDRPRRSIDDGKSMVVVGKTGLSKEGGM